MYDELQRRSEIHMGSREPFLTEKIKINRKQTKQGTAASGLQQKEKGS